MALPHSHSHAILDPTPGCSGFASMVHPPVSVWHCHDGAAMPPPPHPSSSIILYDGNFIPPSNVFDAIPGSHHESQCTLSTVCIIHHPSLHMSNMGNLVYCSY